MSERKDDDDYLGKGLSSVIRRQRARDGSVEPASGAPLGPPPRLEDVDGEHPTELAGRAVVDLIGRGGVGLVYRVADRQLGRELAVKILSRRHADEPEMVARFAAEAKICAQLQHPGIVPIHEAGVLADGRPYFTMKVVEGDTLVDLLAARAEPFANWRSLLPVFAKICQTLAFVHAQGVVHGDLKPSNVMVGAFGEVQVMDWGFARAIDPEVAARLPAGAGQGGAVHILGTPAYMAPEQARGDEAAITSRTDVFGLGAILCEILTGRPPYSGETRSATYLQATQCQQDDARAALQACDADASLVDLAMRCLNPDPGARPMDAAAVGDEIDAYLESAEQRAYELELKAVAAEARADQVGRSRRVVVSLGSALLVAVIAVAAALLWWQQDRSDRQAETHRLIAQATERARAAADRAREQPIGEAAHWDVAEAAARQAGQLAASRGVAAGEQELVGSLLQQIELEAAAARRLRELLVWLESTRPHYTDDRRAHGVADAYRRGFARFGLHFAAPTDELAARIQASPLAGAICGAIDDWARVARNLPDVMPGWRELVAIARRADPQPFRDRLRAAFAADDREELLQLAGSPQLSDEPAATVNLLAKCLFDLGAGDEAVNVLRAALARHPDDFWILHDLALFLGRQPTPPVDEILGLGRAAVAVRPRDPHALADLAYAHAFLRDEWGSAGVVLGRALQLDPAYSRSWFAEVLLLSGHPAQGLQMAQRCARQQPKDSAAQRVLGWTAHIQGEREVAEAAFRAACELAPDALEPRGELLDVLVDRGDLAGARDLARHMRDQIERSGVLAWSLPDAASRDAVEVTLSLPPMHERSGWPDVVRALARCHAGQVEVGVEELSAWLPQAVGDDVFGPCMVGGRAALAAAARSANAPDRERWQDAALQFLRTALSNCEAMVARGASRRLILTRLRWLQWQPEWRGVAWGDAAGAQAEQLQASLERLLAEQLRH